MAVVLDSLAPCVKKLIADMAQEEVSMLLGVSGEITKLEDNMESIKAFLGDAERRRVTDQGVQIWVRKLKNAMYDATDILDLCQLEADKRRGSKGGSSSKQKVPGCFQPLLFCMRNPVFAHEIGSRIKELNQQLDEIYRGAAKFNFITNLSSYQDQRILTDAEQSSSLKTTSEFDEMTIVGENIKRETKELTQVLVTNNGNHDLKVVSIVGMGGMGKTTLAQKIFNEPDIQEHFKVKVWLSVTKHFDRVELLRFAIKHAGGRHGGKQDRTLLMRNLTYALSMGRFLLVLDDMWSAKAWSDVLCVPARKASQKQSGSRVLITTRLQGLASMMGEFFHQHHVSPLDVEDAWSLLKKQLPPTQVVGIDGLKNIGMKNIGMKILNNCPFAGSPAWSTVGLPEQLDNRIYLSYEDLSPQLKQCFLYCSLFPKGEEIAQGVVTLMWISEGFIQPPDESSSHDEYMLEEIATEYYRELIRRNLIEPTLEHSLTGYMCTMHDVVRSFAKYMAREESVVVVHNRQAATCGGSRGGAMPVRRLSIGETVSAVEWAVLQKQKALRTLIVNSSINYQSGDSLESFSNLRILYIWSADTNRLVASLSKLKHLRYLHLEDTDISRLPEDIQQLKFLQYINLMGCEKLRHLPSSIIKLVHLRSLNITKSNVTIVPKGFGGLTNLRILKGFPVHVDDMDRVGGSSRWCSLQELAPLSQLTDLTLHGLEKVPASWMAKKAMISSKAHLGYLELNYNIITGGHTTTRPPCGGGEAVEQQQQLQQSVIEEMVLEKLCPPTRCIETLAVRGGYAGRRLPNWMHALASAMNFKSLRFLKMSNLSRCTQLPNGLCYLPCLEMLSIKVAPAIKCIGSKFQASSSLLPAGDTSAAALPPLFPKLRNLQLRGLCEWEKWEWEWNDDGCEERQESAKAAAIAMPCLVDLTVENCKLSYLPPGLASINRHALRELSLYNLSNLTYVENFPSAVELDVLDCPELKRISGLPNAHKITISRCPKLEVLEGAPSLDSLVLYDNTMRILPEYLQTVHPRFLDLGCSTSLYMALLSPCCSERSMISHIEKQDIGVADSESEESSDED